MDLCFSCNGTCLEPGHSRSKCPLCKGNKHIVSMRGLVKTWMECFQCAGTGEVILAKDKCLTCNGLGTQVLLDPVSIDELPVIDAEVIEPSKAKKALDKLKSVKPPKINLRIPDMKNPFKRKPKETE